MAPSKQPQGRACQEPCGRGSPFKSSDANIWPSASGQSLPAKRLRISLCTDTVGKDVYCSTALSLTVIGTQQEKNKTAWFTNSGNSHTENTTRNPFCLHSNRDSQLGLWHTPFSGSQPVVRAPHGGDPSDIYLMIHNSSKSHYEVATKIILWLEVITT